MTYLRKANRILKTDFGALVAYEFTKNLAISSLGIFIPIILFDASGTLLVPGVYLLLRAGTSAVSSVPVMNHLQRYGFRNGLYLSYLFLLTPVLLLQFLDYSLLTMVMVAVLYEIGLKLHGQAKNVEFTEATKKKDRERRSADLSSLPSFGLILGPIIGGTLSAFFGFSALLLFAIAMILISVFPLQNLSRIEKKTKISTTSVFQKAYLPYTPIFFSRGVQAVASVALYGLFTYEFLSGSFGSGLVRSLDTLGFVVVAYISAYLTSKLSRKTIISVGSLLAALTYLARSFVQTSLQGFLIAFLGGIAFKLYQIPLFSQLADKAESTSKTRFFTLSGICSGIGAALTAVLFITTLQINSRIAFNSVFIFAAVNSLVIPVIENTFGLSSKSKHA